MLKTPPIRVTSKQKALMMSRLITMIRTSIDESWKGSASAEEHDGLVQAAQSARMAFLKLFEVKE